MDASPLLLSLSVAVTATAIDFLLGIFAARWVVGLKHCKGLADGLLTLPMVLPPTVVGFFLLLLFGKHGPLGRLLSLLHLSVVFTWWGAVIAASVVALPLMYRTVRGAFEQLDPDLADAGRTLGMSEWAIFRRVLLPNSWPGIAAGTVLTFARALGEFGATAILAGNIPGKTQTVSLAIYLAMNGNHRERVYLWAGIILLLSFLSMLALNFFTGWYARRVS